MVEDKVVDRPATTYTQVNFGTMIAELYKINERDYKNFKVNVEHVEYSNTQYIQGTDKDVSIDFLQLPGIKQDGKIVINATRVIMSYDCAKELADGIIRVFATLPPKK